MRRYRTAKQLHDSHFVKLRVSDGMIQLSQSTNMILDMQGGYVTEERGSIEVKVRQIRYFNLEI